MYFTLSTSSMVEQQLPDTSGSVDPPPPATTVAAASAALLPVSLTYPTENNPSNIASVSNTGYTGLGPGPGLAPKRQRRPSVRLGEIGEQSFDHARSHSRRSKSAYRFHKDPSLASKTSKTRPLTNLVNGGDAFTFDDNQEEDNNFSYDFGSKKPATKKPTKRARTIWVSSAAKIEAAASNGGGVNENDSTYRDENHETDGFRDIEAEVSDSPMKERSPVHSEDNQNMGLHFWDRRATRTRGSRSESLDRHENNHNINNNRNNAVDGIQDINSGDENRSGGVRDWLVSLGLGRYAPVFEIHEVDDEVLPMLTLEDLKDMGINAVGSRRKLYAGILKLREGFS